MPNTIVITAPDPGDDSSALRQPAPPSDRDVILDGGVYLLDDRGLAAVRGMLRGEVQPGLDMLQSFRKRRTRLHVGVFDSTSLVKSYFAWAVLRGIHPPPAGEREVSLEFEPAA